MTAIKTLICRWICRRIFPWQYNYENRVSCSVNRTWEPNRDKRIAAEKRFLRQYGLQKKLERILPFASWVKRQSGLIYVEQ